MDILVYLQTLFESISARQFAIAFFALAVWSVIWKGIALWYSARNHQKRWFIALLILNTAGIAEIIYLLWFRRDKQPGETKSLFNNPLPDPDGKGSLE